MTDDEIPANFRAAALRMTHIAIDCQSRQRAGLRMSAAEADELTGEVLDLLSSGLKQGLSPLPLANRQGLLTGTNHLLGSLNELRDGVPHNTDFSLGDNSDAPQSIRTAIATLTSGLMEYSDSLLSDKPMTMEYIRGLMERTLDALADGLAPCGSTALKYRLSMLEACNHALSSFTSYAAARTRNWIN